MTLSSASPGLYYDENSELPLHASLSYHVVMAAGPPAHPLEFPMPTVHRAVSVSGLAIDHRKHDRVYEIHGALMGRTEKRTAYQFQKKLPKHVSVVSNSVWSFEGAQEIWTIIVLENMLNGYQRKKWWQLKHLPKSRCDSEGDIISKIP